MQQLHLCLNQLAEGVGKAAAWLALLMVLLQFAVVLFRYVFEMGSIAIQESVVYMHAALFMLCAAYTAKHQGHVRVDIFYRRFSSSTQAKVDLAGAIILLIPTAIFLAVASFDYVGSSWRILEGSDEAGGLDAVFLLKSLIPALALLLLAQGLNQITASLLVISGAQPDDEEEGINV